MKCATTSGLFLVLFLSSPSLAQRLPESDSRLERGLVVLTELESEFGNNSTQLVPALTEMADLYRDEGRFAEAYRMLDRAAQVIRVSEGLYTRSQIPLVRMKVENYSDWGDWDSARNSEHLFWLQDEIRSGRQRLNC